MLWERYCDRVGLDSVVGLSDGVLGFLPRRVGRRWNLTTALHVALILGSLLALSPATAQQAVSILGSPDPLIVSNDDNCSFVGHCAQITTSAKDASINFVNSGNFDAGLNGIFTSTGGLSASIAIENAGDIKAISRGISATVNGGGSNLILKNSGGIAARGDGISVLIFSFGAEGNLALENAGDIHAGGYGIFAETASTGGDLSIKNSGDIASNYIGILAFTPRDESHLTLNNAGAITVTSNAETAHGIVAETTGIGGVLNLENSGAITTKGTSAHGILVHTDHTDSSIALKNSGDILTTGPLADAITAASLSSNSGISIDNSGDIFTAGRANGITAESAGAASAITIDNLGDIVAGTFGIRAVSSGINSPITVTSGGLIDPDIGLQLVTLGPGSPIAVESAATIEGTHLGIDAFSLGEGSPVSITNSGTVTSTGGNVPFVFAQGGLNFAVFSAAIGIGTNAAGNNILIDNNGTLQGRGVDGIGIYALAAASGGTTKIINARSIYGGFAAILSDSAGGTEIVNSGDVSAGSFFAVGVYGGDATILNTGHITGYVMLDADDVFINQNGGVFQTKLTSDFGPGNDLFRNEAGGTVLAATDADTIEHSAFVGLERFENQGFITVQDGAAGDSFEISNTVGGRDLAFIGSGNSTLVVDAFLGGPGSKSDTFTINGDVSGKTLVDVNNTNGGLGTFNKDGIPVIAVNGNVKGDEFFLNKPIDTGFFDYDLFFRPTGGHVFELKSFLGAEAFILPQLITAVQDVWHVGSDTWFGRTADLRVLLNGGAAPAYDANTKYGETDAQVVPNITPAMWVRGGGNWLDRDDSETVSAYGRSYRYNLNSELDTIDFQGGIDFGKRDLLSDKDILVFGAFGGYVHADLDYNAINSIFNFEGGQVGGYVTYLRGGLFVDTLLNVHILEVETKTVGFPNSLDATTVGLRTDTGYRFGRLGHGAFIEPLATISINWADISGFSLGPNKVSFDGDPNVRGRLGLRIGTSMQVWTGTTMEPFVTGSLWGNLSDDNQATLASTGTTFILKDNLNDVWSEVSAGVNFFNPSANTSVFAKLDVTFGDDLEGVGGKAGMRVSW